MSTASRDRWWAIQHRFAPYLFIAPFVVLFCCFLIYPLGRSIELSFYKAVGPKSLKFDGLGNFRFVFFTPHLVGQVFVAVIFSQLLAPRHGLLNLFVGLVAPWIGSEVNWFG